MSGNTEAARIWDGADVYVDLTGDAPAPTDLTTALDTSWKALGLITQDGGISETNSQQETQHFAHGNILVRTSYGQQTKTMAAEAMENTDLVFKLSNPGSTSSTTGGVTERLIKPAKPSLAICQVVLELSDGDIVQRRWMPKVQWALNGDQNTTDQAVAGTPLIGTQLAKTVDLGGDIGVVTILGREWSNDPATAVESA